MPGLGPGLYAIYKKWISSKYPLFSFEEALEKNSEGVFLGGGYYVLFNISGIYTYLLIYLHSSNILLSSSTLNSWAARI